jgi:hypothetical protein
MTNESQEPARLLLPPAKPVPKVKAPDDKRFREQLEAERRLLMSERRPKLGFRRKR